MSQAARSACSPGAIAPRSGRPRQSGRAARRHVQQLARRRPAGGIVGFGAAVGERGDAEVAEQVRTVVRRAPGGAEPEGDARRRGRRAPARSPNPCAGRARSGARPPRPAAAISAISAGGRIDDVREPGAGLRPAVLDEQLPRRAAVARAAPRRRRPSRRGGCAGARRRGRRRARRARRTARARRRARRTAPAPPAPAHPARDRDARRSAPRSGARPRRSTARRRGRDRG